MSNNRIKVLHLVNGLAIGGAEKHLLQSLDYIDRNRFDVTVCSVGQGGDLERAYRKTGLPLIILNKKNRLDFSLPLKIARLIRDKEIQLMQTTLYYADIMGALASIFCPKLKIISVEHSLHHENDPLRKRWYHVLTYRLAMRRVHRIIAVSNDIKRTLIQYRNIPEQKIVTIHNGIALQKSDPQDVAGLKKELKIPAEFKVMGIVARLDPVKGHSTLFKALKIVREACSGFICLVIGDGQLRQELENETLSLGLESHVQFLGFREDVEDLIFCCDFMALPSLSEGLPMTLLEGMGRGRPFVASRVGGIPEIIRHEENGLLVEKESPNQLSAAILRMLTDDGVRLRLGEAAKNTIERTFSAARENALYEAEYLKCYGLK